MLSPSQIFSVATESASHVLPWSLLYATTMAPPSNGSIFDGTTQNTDCVEISKGVDDKVYATEYLPTPL